VFCVFKEVCVYFQIAELHEDVRNINVTNGVTWDDLCARWVQMSKSACVFFISLALTSPLKSIVLNSFRTGAAPCQVALKTLTSRI